MILAIFDFDGVLYRTGDMKEELIRRLSERGIPRDRFQDAYTRIKREYGYFDPNLLVNYLPPPQVDICMEIFDTFPYADFVEPDARELLERLMTKCVVVILSQGDTDSELPGGFGYQVKKIEACGLPSHRTIVSRDKIYFIHDLYRGYESEVLVVVDDRPEVLESCPEGTIKIRIGPGYHSLREAIQIIESLES
jgi:hypothetical protein